jgi:hypothetical protein
MKNKLYLFCSLIFIASLTSCSYFSKKDLTVPLPIQAFRIQLDEVTSNFGGNRIQLVKIDGKEVFILMNPLVNKLIFYNYPSGEYVMEKSFQKEGPLGVGDIASFYFNNSDSLFFTGKNPNFLYLTNIDNSFLTRYSFNFTKENRGKIPVLTDESGIIFFKNSIYLTNLMAYVPGMSSAPIEYKDLSNSFFSFTFDLKSETSSYNNLIFPQVYGNSIYPDYFNTISQQLINDQILYSFGLSDSIILYSPSNNKKNQHLVKFSGESHYKKLALAEKIEDIRPDNESEQLDLFLNSFNYKRTLYDQYKRLYYRFIEFPKPDVNNSFPQRMKPLGLIVLDDQFNLIGEYDLGYGKYTSVNAFVSEQGLNILNYEKIITEESSITFDIFDFSM